MALSLGKSILILQEDTDIPPLDMVALTLSQCRKEKKLACARQLQMIAIDNGLDTNLRLGNFIVPMLVECGSVLDAQQVFYRLLEPNEHTWTSLIQGYNEYGDPHIALDLFEEMRRSYVIPSVYTYLALVKACARLGLQEMGRVSHDDICKRGYDEEDGMCHSLMEMYAECGLMLEAKKLFDVLRFQEDAVPWTSLLRRYVAHGRNEEALQCFMQMHIQGVVPNDVAFICLVKACSNTGALDEGRKFYADIIKEGLEENRYVGNVLLDLYIKCGSLAEGQEVFHDLVVRDTVSWTSLIAGYVEYGLGERALHCLDQMNLEGVEPNSVTYSYALKACCILGAIDQGKVFHAMMTKRGFDVDDRVGCSLVGFYSKCSLLADAQAVFDALPGRSVVLWTVLIAGYAEDGLGKEALRCFEQMQRENIYADAVTFVYILQVCARLDLFERGLLIHNEIVKDGFEKDIYVESTLVDMYAKCGLLKEAQHASDEMLVQSVISWTALAGGYVECGYGERALACISEMRFQGLFPNAFTFMYGLKASMIVQSIKDGQELHMDLVKRGFDKDLFLCSALVEMYAKSGFILDCTKVFSVAPMRDIVLWNSLIVGYVECELVEEALDCFQGMQMEAIKADVASWNVILLGFAEQGHDEKVIDLYVRMLDQAVLPDSTTFIGLMKACGNKADVGLGRLLHAQMMSSKNFDPIGSMIGSALVDMYCKCGCMEDALLLFSEMPQRDTTVWSILLSGCARYGKHDEVFRLLEEMRVERIQPNEYTFLSMLVACNYAGDVNKALLYFKMMSEEFGISPNIAHQNCIIDMLSRAGQLKEATALIRSMSSIKPDIVTWKTVLGACHKGAYLELGQWAFEHATQSSKNDGATFTLMSNILADASMQETTNGALIYSMCE